MKKGFILFFVVLFFSNCTSYVVYFDHEKRDFSKLYSNEPFTKEDADFSDHAGRLVVVLSKVDEDDELEIYTENKDLYCFGKVKCDSVLKNNEGICDVIYVINSIPDIILKFNRKKIILPNAYSDVYFKYLIIQLDTLSKKKKYNIEFTNKRRLHIENRDKGNGSLKKVIPIESYEERSYLKDSIKIMKMLRYD